MAVEKGSKAPKKETGVGLFSGLRGDIRKATNETQKRVGKVLPGRLARGIQVVYGPDGKPAVIPTAGKGKELDPVAAGAMAGAAQAAIAEKDKGKVK